MAPVALSREASTIVGRARCGWSLEPSLATTMTPFRPQTGCVAVEGGRRSPRNPASSTDTIHRLQRSAAGCAERVIASGALRQTHPGCWERAGVADDARRGGGYVGGCLQDRCLTDSVRAMKEGAKTVQVDWLAMFLAVVVVGFGLGIHLRPVGRSDPCGNSRPLASSVVPEPRGFQMVSNISVDPDCGDSYSRDALLVSRVAPTADALPAYVKALAAHQWEPTDCARVVDFCFLSPDKKLFLAAQPAVDSFNAMRIRVHVQPRAFDT